MPIHDWTQVDAGLFRAFHQSWMVAIQNALNAGTLPPDYYALVEQRVGGPIPDVVTLRLPDDGGGDDTGAGGTAVAAPPQTRVKQVTAALEYAHKADRVTVHHRHGDVVAVIEIVSPGNKASKAEFRSFVQKTTDLMNAGVHLLVVDMFPPTPRDPAGLHAALWEEVAGTPEPMPADKPLTLAAYEAGPELTAYVEPVAVGDPLPNMPVFLRPGWHVPVPLEPTYQITWQAFPARLRRLLEPAG